MLGFAYTVRMAPTAVTVAKTLVQVKAGAAAIEVTSVRLYQVTKTASELWNLQLIQWSAAPTTWGTVTGTTPLPLNAAAPASLAVSGANLTGVNATVEPSGGTGNIVEETDWNILNGEWLYLPVPEARIMAPQTLGFTLKLNTAPAASTTIGAVVTFLEWR